jgi:hypothetical protein
VRNARVRSGDNQDDDSETAETQARMWNPLSVAAGTKVMPMRLEEEIAPI